MSPNIPSPVNLNPTMFGLGSPTAAAAAAMQTNGGGAPNLSAMMTQQRLLELSGFNLRGYDLAQHMLSQQGNVSKLLGECKLTFSPFHLFVIRARNHKILNDRLNNVYKFNQRHPLYNLMDEIVY